VLSRAIIVDRWRGAEASRALSWVAMFTFLSPVLRELRATRRAIRCGASPRTR
jgi:hypothetical protein